MQGLVRVAQNVFAYLDFCHDYPQKNPCIALEDRRLMLPRAACLAALPFARRSSVGDA